MDTDNDRGICKNKLRFSHLLPSYLKQVWLHKTSVDIVFNLYIDTQVRIFSREVVLICFLPVIIS